MSRKRRRRKKNGFTRQDLARLPVVIVAMGLGILLAWMAHADHPKASPRQADPPAASEDTIWAIGQLRENRLRIVPSEPSDASAVLEPEQFAGQTRQAYWIATQIPEVLNHLYCWCGCENRGVHRSNLGCFEDSMGVKCDVGQGTARIAYDMVQNGENDLGDIQAAVDAQWAPPRHREAWL